MVTVTGQLAIKKVNGRYGEFKVGRLKTSFGEFAVKDAQLDQYDEGKYDGDFIIDRIFSKPIQTSGGLIIETRANLGGMTLINLAKLSTDEVHRLSPQEPDPMEEEKPLPSAASAPVMIPVPEAPLHAGTADDAPTQSAVPTPESAPVGQLHDDSALFGPLWPLSQLVKLDSTISRQTLRAQRDRLDTLGYKFRYQTQDWLLAVH